jgi:hypothetical protein
VDEAATCVAVRNGKSTVLLAVENGSGRALAAQVKLEWLTPSGTALESTSRVEQLAPGTSTVAIPFRLPPRGGNNDIWDRLRYQLEAEGDQSAGILPLARIAGHVFELRIAAPLVAGAGEGIRVPVYARHPISGQPVAGVTVRLRKQQQVTGADGLATLDYHVPEKGEDDARLTVRGILGDFRQTVETNLTVNRQPYITISTDKPIYQPGQTLHVRALIFTPAGRALAGAPVSIRVLDPEGIRVFVAPAETSRFGVVSADWRVPENTRLGDYTVAIQGEKFVIDGTRRVKISRYDLPEFTVTAKADRPYYLPGQDAWIEVKGEYLFGKHVASGHVRVVREVSREWNYREQKWEVEEAEVYQGEADTSGLFAVRVTLAKPQAELAKSEWKRYEDLGFTAYYRDSSSGRTEQRRFDVRISRDAIHIYLLRGYLSTSYADGTPAACRVTINGGAPVATNRYGVARLPEDIPEGDLLLVASDGRGAKGRLEENHYRSEQALRIHTDRTLYHPGEPIHVEMESAEAVPVVSFAIRRGEELLETRWLHLPGGRATFDIPWRKEFTREVTVAANWGEREFAARTVLYPADTDLHVEVRPGAAAYRPGEEATAAIAVHRADGRPVESALGVAVVDRAVEERARTDAESAEVFRWRHLGSAGAREIGGVSREDLYRLDTRQPFPPDLDLLAEVMLADEGYGAQIETGADYYTGLHQTFAPVFQAQFKPIAAALDERYKTNYEYPRDLQSLCRVLREGGVDFDSLRDPWGEAYRVEGRINGALDELVFSSAGPDKRFGTQDDLVVWTIRRHYFRPVHDAVARALSAGGDFPSTAERARALLSAAHIDPDGLADRWGTPYRFHFSIQGPQGRVTFTSAGPDRVFGTEDDFTVDTVSGPYFAGMKRTLDELLAGARNFPQSQNEWRALLRRSGLDPRDPWGRPLYAVFSRQSSYSDLRKLYTAAQYGGEPGSKTVIIPVTLRFLSMRLSSAGPDGIEGTRDDFELATFQRSYHIETGQKPALPKPAAPSKDGGSVSGKVTDPTGEPIPNATLMATSGDLTYATRSGADGSYRLAGLEAGVYEVRVEAPGFQLFVTSKVPVTARATTSLDIALCLGAVAETVVVQAAAMPLQTASAQISVVPSQATGPRSTPRLREYFPETLLWQPSLETGADGLARLQFKLADNITTWRMSVTGSTEDGQIGTATADIRAFQPFFLDHDPPRILTQGDQIDLPVTVRNYLERAQTVAVSLQPANWFEIGGPARREIGVPAGASANAVFRVRAAAPVTDGKQRLIASAAETSDAVEKPVTVHPDGQEISQTSNAVLRRDAALTLDLPSGAIGGSAHAELKIYPNLLSHLLESIEGIIQRPYGCAEQTISSSWPSLLLLRYLEETGRADHPLAARARTYLQSSVERLAGYRTESGGLGYWSGSETDAPLSAYGLIFLTAAAQFVAVDEQVTNQMRDALLRQQAADGSWLARDWQHRLDVRRTALNTAYVARALAAPNPPDRVHRALQYLAARAAEIDEPYLIATFAQAANQAGDKEAFTKALDRLRGLARHEAGLNWWNLETNTPFYGWGLAGRLETTAAAVSALAAGGQPGDRELIDTGMLFLTRNKDRYGVWHSTQATVQVLNAILAAAGHESAGEPGSAEILVNGRPAATLQLPRANEITGPLRADLSAYLTPGRNEITVRRQGETVSAQVQLTGSYYVRWPDTAQPQTRADLKLSVTFDRLSAATGDPITCRVHAERVGFRGYGMLLAEIGLPPGADVDRQSLDHAGIDHYDVLPDRLVIYLWPRAGGVDFRFRFRPRFAMRAKAAASSLYDYYNPEAQAVVTPAKFVVSEPRH